MLAVLELTCIIVTAPCAPKEANKSLQAVEGVCLQTGPDLEFSSSCICSELSWKARNMDSTCMRQLDMIRALKI